MKPKKYLGTYEVGDKRTLTLAALVMSTQIKEEETKEEFARRMLEGNARRKLKTVTMTGFSVGWAIKNPTDNVSPKELGEAIAIGRAQTNPIFTCALHNPRMSEALIREIMDAIAKEVDDRFYSFVPLGRNGKKTKKKEVIQLHKNGAGKTSDIKEAEGETRLHTT